MGPILVLEISFLWRPLNLQVIITSKESLHVIFGPFFLSGESVACGLSHAESFGGFFIFIFYISVFYKNIFSFSKFTGI